MKRKPVGCLVFSLLLSFLFSSNVMADPWAVVTNLFDGTINTIDLGTSPPTVYGPFLQGELGTKDGLLDVAVTPDNRYALVSNYSEQTVYFIDITDPANPKVDGSVNIGFGAEDIAITPDSHYAFVTDGASSPNQIAVIDISSKALKSVYTLNTTNARAQCVATNGSLIVVCDCHNDQIVYMNFNPSTGAIFNEQTASAGSNPINAAFSPDGRTLLVANCGNDTVSVYEVNATITPSLSTPSISGLPGGQQSIAISGTRAYVVSNGGTNNDSLSWLQINGPGNVTLGQSNAASLLSDTTGGFYGVDVIGVTPDGKFAIVGNPSFLGEASENVALVDLSSFNVTSIPTSSRGVPVGVAVFSHWQLPTVMTVPTLTEWGVILLMTITFCVAAVRIRHRMS